MFVTCSCQALPAVVESLLELVVEPVEPVDPVVESVVL